MPEPSLSKSALLVAFHFPPIKVSSGLERTLAMARHLPQFGWRPLVLSASPRAYPAVSNERLGQIPSAAVVRRSWALDASRHLSIAGRYPGFLALPDRWQNWMLSAIPLGLSMIRQHRPAVIWSTYPIASAHWIGYALHRLSGLPWVADFRDPMVEQDPITGDWSPASPQLRKARLAIERRAAAHAQALTFCTDGARQICRSRHASTSSAKWQVVANGFDEASFSTAEANLPKVDSTRPLTLVHSGTIYPTPDRDPVPFFRALRRVLDQRPAHARPLRVVLRASGVETLYVETLGQLRLSEHVRFEPTLPHQDALREMLQADGLLIFQGRSSNPAIPAKLYEYFRCRRPVFALADAEGETAGLLRSEGVGQLVPLDDEKAIADGLSQFLADIETGAPGLMTADRIAAFERAQTVGAFAALFDDLTGRKDLGHP